MIDVYPDKIHYFDHKAGRHFTLIVTEGLKGNIRLHNSKQYSTVKELVCGNAEDVNDLVLVELPKNSDVLFFPLYYPKPSPMFDHHSLDKTQRIFVFGCTPTTHMTLDTVSHFAPLIYGRRRENFLKKADAFYQKLERASYVHYRNPIYNTCATLTINEFCLWIDMFGQVNPGEIGVLPTGEIALSHSSFNDPTIPTVELNGEIILHGLPILHGYQYNDKNFLKEQEYLYHKLTDLQSIPLKCTIRSGVITDLQEPRGGMSKAKCALEKLFSKDSRYRHISEIGIGLDSKLIPINENCSLNESYGGSSKCIHFAMGMPSLDYHLDIICPDTQIETSEGDMLVDAQTLALNHIRAPVCPCENTFEWKHSAGS